MRRLYLQIYADVLAILVVFALLGRSAWSASADARRRARQISRGVARVLARVLPPATAPRADAQAALEQLRARPRDDVDAARRCAAPMARCSRRAGAELPAPTAAERESGFLHRRHGAIVRACPRLPDGRTLVARRPHGAHDLGWLVGDRRARRGDRARRLSGRAAHHAPAREAAARRSRRSARATCARACEVRGADEIADLARSFNRAAAQIEQLVARAAQRCSRSASHELRSPLARIRVAIELLGGRRRRELRARVSRDIAELDELIGELLLASRLEALAPGRALDRRETIDLLASRRGGGGAHAARRVDGEPVNLRRRSHAPAPARAQPARERAPARPAARRSRSRSRSSAAGRARLRVSDRGPGVPESERERIFAPFYRPSGASESRDGSFGLGLALVRQIARHHGGEARCHAARGRRHRVRGRSRRCPMTVSLPDHPGVIAKPPSLFMAALAAGFALELAFPTQLRLGARAARARLALSSARASGSSPRRCGDSAARARTSRRIGRPRRSSATVPIATRATRSTSGLVPARPRARRRQPLAARAAGAAPRRDALRCHRARGGVPGAEVRRRLPRVPRGVRRWL